MVTNCGMLHDFLLSLQIQRLGKKDAQRSGFTGCFAHRLGFMTFPFSNPEIGKKDYAPNMSMTTCFNFLCMPTD
jgi:hypothetical protein